MQALMEEQEIPLTALESGQELTSFDLVGFTLQHELSYTNILKMLDLARIPRRSRERSGMQPLIMAGGPSAFNVEPLADFLDFVVLGEGEEIIHEIIDLVKQGKAEGASRDDLLEQLAQVEGIYVPKFYKPVYDQDGRFLSLEPLRPDIPREITKRVIKDFNSLPYPEEFVVPMWK